jgi:putative endonuclease
MPAQAGIQGEPRIVRQPFVYILARGRNGTLYVGVTGDIARRTWIHRSDIVPGFTKRYGVHRLVYVEAHATMLDAILREKQIKKMAAGMETPPDRRGQPAMARPI